MSIRNYVYFSIKKNLGRFSLVITTSVDALLLGFSVVLESRGRHHPGGCEEEEDEKEKEKREVKGGWGCKDEEDDDEEDDGERHLLMLCTSRIPASNDDCILSLILSLQAEEAGLMRKPTINQSLSGDFGMVISSH